ncbi:divalent-cation tolerance protein CutA [Pelagibius sp. CAU 1746]|uniref:divalent-cation tolerance protein CutA n=1 Tax=Pelagibius sp. CAU 1746 TaxID=3140370 RepID=UPI00325BE5B7
MSVNYSHCLVYVTAADVEEAREIGRSMVEARLAACANVFPEMVPIFLWNGDIGEGSESVVIMKTTRERAGDLIAAVEAMHSYECPCAVILPVAGGSQAFLDWISSETTPEGGA